MRRVAALLVAGTMVVTALVTAPTAVAGGGPEIKAEPPTLEETVDLALADVQDFWAKNMKRAYEGGRYEPVEKLFPYDSQNFAEVTSCGTYVPEEYQPNAFYCPAEEKLVWDIEGLFPDLYSNISYLAVVEVLAHEFGHAVQHQGRIPADSPSILLEQSADCFAGTYIRYLADGKSKRFPDVTADDVDTMVSAMLKFRDAVGSPSTDPTAHGSAFDRINALQEGYELGPGRCARYDGDAPDTLDLVFTDPVEESSGGNLDLESVTAMAQTDLDDFWSHALTKYRPVALVVPYDVDTVERLPQCGDEQEPRENFRNVVFYCADGSFVAWDNAILEGAHDTYGDFAVVTLLANQWSSHVQKLLGIPFSKGSDRHKICLTGAYVGNLYRKSRPSRQLELSPGDLDEAVQVQLDYLPAKGKGLHTFSKVSALRRGFFQGADSCHQLLPKAQRPRAG